MKNIPVITPTLKDMQRNRRSLLLNETDLGRSLRFSLDLVPIRPLGDFNRDLGKIEIWVITVKNFIH